MLGARDYETRIDGRDVVVLIDVIDYPKFSIESVTEIHPDCERCGGSGEIVTGSRADRRDYGGTMDTCPECGGDKELTLTKDQEADLYEEISIDLADSMASAAEDARDAMEDR